MSEKEEERWLVLENLVPVILGTCYSLSMAMGSARGLDGVTSWVFGGSVVGSSVGSSV